MHDDLDYGPEPDWLDDIPHPAAESPPGIVADAEYEAVAAKIEAALLAATDEGVAKELRAQLAKAKRARDRKVAKRLTGELRVVSPGEAPPFPTRDATLEWDEVRFGEVVTDTAAAIVEAGVDLFERSGEIVEISKRGTIRAVGPVRLRDVIAAHVLFVEGGKPIAVPELVAKTLCERPDTGLHELTSVIRAPTLRPDGSILETPGYDPPSGLYYMRDDLAHEPMIQFPTRRHAEAALAFLLEPIQDFPFIDATHRAAAVAYLMTCVLRTSIDGPCPGFAFDAPSPGTGKTMLASMGGWVAHGESPPISQYTHDVEEQGKRVQATLSAGVPLVIWDNIIHKFGSEITDALLTSRKYTSRVLGQSKMPVYVNNTVWTFNGNNLRLNNADSIRRIIWVRMMYPKGDPTKRTDIRIGDLHAWVREHRKRLIRACLTVARWGVLNPHPVDRYASFEAWSAMVRAPVMALMDADPCLGAAKDDPDIYEEGSAISCLFREWAIVMEGLTKIGQQHPKWTIVELMKHDQISAAADVLADDVNRKRKILGEVFKRWKGRPVMLYHEDGSEWGMVRLSSDGKAGNKGNSYRLDAVQP